MIDAGLPIVQCLDILCNQTDNKLFAVVLRDVKANVEQGATFSDSLRRHPLPVEIVDERDELARRGDRPGGGGGGMASRWKDSLRSVESRR